MIRLLTQPVGFELLPLPHLQVILPLLGQDQDVADAPGGQERVGIDVPDPVGARPVTALRREIALWLAANPDQPKQLDNRVALSPIENLSNRFPLGRHSLEGQHPDEPGVAVTKPEVLAGQLEDRHSDG